MFKYQKYSNPANLYSSKNFNAFALSFDLLSHIGRDCVGAVQLVPEGERPSVKMVTADRVDESQIEAILKSQYRKTHLF